MISASSTIEMPGQKFLSPDFRAKFQRKQPYFRRHLNFLKHSARLVERSLHATNQINAFIPFVVECDRRWWHGTVVERRSQTGELSLSCARPAADGGPLMWVNRPLQVSQLDQLSLSSFLGR